ncbi:hypothetical protein CVT26_000773 [Gymnopilus dilepis]|uniref:Uncharacterized protein n=1 Tax=Gymnopilus dilepis TaxID=231916 RepID=A0A409Y2K0_9AGAR|nr:hypothetical protein CVT26_000773 [Gymnopilus dilepis]
MGTTRTPTRVKGDYNNWEPGRVRGTVKRVRGTAGRHQTKPIWNWNGNGKKASQITASGATAPLVQYINPLE